jgi:hypothetical protein
VGHESWGRYWDPKETWALISIMVYAFVIHARFVPSLRGKWTLTHSYVCFRIYITYYGVNFHLVGLHSYASGDTFFKLDLVFTGTITFIGALLPNIRNIIKIRVLSN